jgi:RNA polymerase sigma-70 factor (ECF subfamily)
VTDPRLVARAQLGDRRALDALLAELQAPLHRHLAALLGDPDAADDALQDVLWTVSRKLGALRDPRWFRAWAYRVATREGVRQARRARRLPEPTDPHDLDAVAAEEGEARFDPELVASMPAAVEALPLACRLVLRMHYLDGLTLAEVAEALEIAPGTVRSRLAYGLAALRRRVGAELHPTR